MLGRTPVKDSVVPDSVVRPAPRSPSSTVSPRLALVTLGLLPLLAQLPLRCQSTASTVDPPLKAARVLSPVRRHGQRPRLNPVCRAACFRLLVRTVRALLRPLVHGASKRGELARLTVVLVPKPVLSRVPTRQLVNPSRPQTVTATRAQRKPNRVTRNCARTTLG